MPQIANITVKKNDGTTDVTYTYVQPSAGDKSPAIWRSQSVGAMVSARPELRMSARPNGTGTARRVDTSYTYPYTVTGTDGVTRVQERLNLTLSGLVPAGMPDADVNEAVSQGLNLLAATLTKDSYKAGFAPG